MILTSGDRSYKATSCRCQGHATKQKERCRTHFKVTSCVICRLRCIGCGANWQADGPVTRNDQARDGGSNSDRDGKGGEDAEHNWRIYGVC